MSTRYLLELDDQSHLEVPHLALVWRRKKYLLLSCAILAVGVLVLLASLTNHPSAAPKSKKNVIMMVSDGLGHSTLSLARSFLEAQNATAQLYLDKYLIGSLRTHSTAIVTDSAAGGTALSCGLYTYNSAVAVDAAGVPCGTVLEAAKRAGYLTGMVVTSGLTDATPASFSAHASNREMQDSIAAQQIGLNPLGNSIDLMLGGGLCRFLPNTQPGSCRQDDQDLIQLARQRGFRTITDKISFDNISAGSQKGMLPLVGMFAPGNLDYTIDRDALSQPLLSEMTSTALDLLDAESDKGFFLMVEGARIDMALHSNDPAALAHDLIEYSKTVELVAQWVEIHGGILISTSDHETGGLSTGVQLTEQYPQYGWQPDLLAKVKRSAEFTARVIGEYYRKDHGLPANLTEFVRSQIEELFQIFDCTPEEIEEVVGHQRKNDPIFVEYALARIISRRAGIGYTTHGHTAADVPMFGNADFLRGTHENIVIGQFLAAELGVDLEAITELLNGDDNSWYE